MSLIFEALKKIERDKQAPERGVVVLAQAALAPSPVPASRWPVAVGIAGAVAIVALGAVLWLRPAAPEAPPAAAPALRSEVAPAPIAVAPVVPVTVAPARVATPPPTVPPAAAPPAFRLTAIGSRHGQPVAVIDDQVLQVGDTIGNARVVAIGTSSVELEIDGQRRQITF